MPHSSKARGFLSLHGQTFVGDEVVSPREFLRKMLHLVMKRTRQAHCHYTALRRSRRDDYEGVATATGLCITDRKARRRGWTGGTVGRRVPGCSNAPGLPIERTADRYC